ncbi:MAG: hypothetical protein F6K04_25305 [Leptolyngbya sp. SIO4C5]|nr:hypothetical protein [Leptolyngbya sp. SIO4C5]
MPATISLLPTAHRQTGSSAQLAALPEIGGNQEQPNRHKSGDRCARLAEARG